MNILYTAFNGKNNSSKILLDKINTTNKLYLKNSFSTSTTQLEKELKLNTYDLIISFGQSILPLDTIKIETTGKNKETYKTTYNYLSLKEKLKSNNYNVFISEDAGNYLCNNIYFHGLKLINKNNLKTKMIFIHIPKTKEISSIDGLADIFNESLNWVFDLLFNKK